MSRGSRTCGRWARAAVLNAFDDTVSPELAQFAVPQARQLRKNLIAVINGESTRPFHYKSKGMCAVIGHHNAVGNPFGVRLSGWLAFVMWYAIYWAMTPTFGRKMQIAFDWLMSAFLPPGSHRDIAGKNEAARKR